jgi:hypothetical protein
VLSCTGVTPLARALSIVLHPFATMLAFALLAGGAGGDRTAAVLAAAAVIVPVAALMARRRAAGRWRTVDASEPSERPALLAVAAAAAAAALVAVLLRGHGSGFGRPMLAVLLVFALAAALGRWMKASLHVAFAAFAAAGLLALGAGTGWAFAALVPPLAWSRLHLRRHTARDVAAGAAVGLAAALVLAAG